MFAARDIRRGESRRRVEVAFTDRWGGVSTGQYAALDLTQRRDGAEDELATNRARLATAMGVDALQVMRQEHRNRVVVVREYVEPPTCDAMVTDRPGLALCVRAADCVPLVLADADAGVVGVAHAGRPGVAAGVVGATVSAMRDLGAERIEAWIGPHVCGGCYEVPARLRAEVAALEPATFACTTWGTPSLDIGAGVGAQLERAGCTVIRRVGIDGVAETDAAICTRESPDLYSYRRQGPASGRQAGLVVLRRDPVAAT